MFSIKAWRICTGILTLHNMNMPRLTSPCAMHSVPRPLAADSKTRHPRFGTSVKGGKSNNTNWKNSSWKLWEWENPVTRREKRCTARGEKARNCDHKMGSCEQTLGWHRRMYMDMHENCYTRAAYSLLYIGKNGRAPHTETQRKEDTPKITHTSTTLGRRGENASPQGYARTIGDCAPRS